MRQPRGRCHSPPAKCDHQIPDEHNKTLRMSAGAGAATSGRTTKRVDRANWQWIKGGGDSSDPIVALARLLGATDRARRASAMNVHDSPSAGLMALKLDTPKPELTVWLVI
jgi:hypothetical protein